MSETTPIETTPIETTHEPCEGCGELLDVTSFGAFERAICPMCSAETRVKRDFGAYRLEQRYAVGGMSVIFVGRDKTLDRKVAIKVLNEEYCNDEIRIQAFENEARLTAQVNHPNVVKVYAVGRAYGRFYLVMELLEGRSFERMMSKQGAIPEAEVLDIASQVAAGLQAAKKSGMIHRDVKPGNILIDREGRARLVDFGLALITQEGSAQAEEIWATPYYVPPEALERGTEDFRSDIYAFGATLYHALAGRPPFESTTTSNSVLRKVKQTIPRLCTVAPWISPATGETIDRMMAYKPEHRWASYEQVKQALEHAKQNIGETPQTPLHSQSRLKRRQKNRIPVIGAAVVSTGLIAGLLFWQPWKKAEPVVIEQSPETPAKPAEPEIFFNPDGGDRESLQKAWKAARALVAKGDYEQASTAFLALANDPTLEGMELVWASFEGSIVSALAAQPGEARAQVARSLRDLKGAQIEEDRALKYRRFARVLRQLPPPSEDAFPSEPAGVIDWLGTFALALKQWDAGLWQEALPSFAKVRGANLPAQFSWVRPYQTLADNYLADGQLLGTIKSLPEPTTPEAASSQIAEIQTAITKLRTRGRASFNLRARTATLARLRKHMQAGPPPPTDWDSALPVLTELGKTCQFEKIATLLKSLESPPSAVAAWQYLNTGAAAFLDELAQQTSWTAARKDGTAFAPEAGKPTPWEELDPASLLAAHTGKPAHAIAFAWLTGLTSQAEELAESLAAQDNDFRRDWRRVIVGTSQ